MNNRKWVCNPLVGAEIIGRSYLETQIKPTGNVSPVLKSIDDILESESSIDGSIAKIKAIHGNYGSGVDSQIGSFVRNLFDNDPAFTKGVLELENILIEAREVVGEFDELIDNIGNLTFQDLANHELRAYLDRVNILLPDAVVANIENELAELPFYTQLSEQLGGIYKDFIIDDKATNIADQIIGDILCETGLSNLLKYDSWLRMLPEYAMNFHDNIRLFQRLGTRVMPKCTYGKIYNIMDEPLAHIYSLAQDAFFFIDFLDNRTAIIGSIVGKYRAMIKRLNTFFPICAEEVVTNTPREYNGVKVNQLGHPIREVSNQPQKTIVVDVDSGK